MTLRITPDRSVADFFVNGGRWSGTSSWLGKAPRAAADSVIFVFGAGVKADIDVWGMGCGWVFPSYTANPTM